jgi:DNA segregation ATPase FtsK/SpoIIIE, S-DNA-T family
VRLRQVLEGEYGIKVPSTGNRYPVDPVAVRSRVAERSTAGGDNDE